MGMLRVFRLPAKENAAPEKIAREKNYQVNYVTGGSSYARTFEDEDRLAEFLLTIAGVDQGRLERALAELRRSGNTNIPGVEIPEREAGAYGLEEMPTSY